MTENNMNPEEMLENIWSHADIQIMKRMGDYTKLINVINQFGSQQFTAGVEAGKRETEKVDVSRQIWMRSEANNVIELTKGFLPEQLNNNIRTLTRMADFILELTAHIPSPPNPDKGGKEEDNGC